MDWHDLSVHIGLETGNSRLGAKGTLNLRLLPLDTLIQTTSRRFIVGLAVGMPP